MITISSRFPDMIQNMWQKCLVYTNYITDFVHCVTKQSCDCTKP